MKFILSGLSAVPDIPAEFGVDQSKNGRVVSRQTDRQTDRRTDKSKL